MQLYFVNCLVGFLVVVATFSTTSARVPSFFGTLAEQPENVDTNGALGKPLLEEPTNELNLVENLPLKKTNQKKKKRILRKYVNVELAEPLEGVVIEEGQSYTLSCAVQAHPEAFIHWVRGENLQEEIAKILETSVAGDSPQLDPNRVAHSYSKYVIDCASKKDAGPIHCVGIAGSQVSYQSTNIIIEASNKSLPPTCSSIRKPVITSNLGAVLSLIGSTVVIPCKAEGFPQPMTRWFDTQGIDVAVNTHNDRYMVLPTGELIIKNLIWDDMGEFKCVAKSVTGDFDIIETFVYPLAKGK